MKIACVHVILFVLLYVCVLVEHDVCVCANCDIQECCVIVVAIIMLIKILEMQRPFSSPLPTHITSEQILASFIDLTSCPFVSMVTSIQSKTLLAFCSDWVYSKCSAQ